MHRFSAAARGLALAHEVDDHGAHDPGRVRKEPCAIPCLEVSGLEKSKIGLVNQRSRVEHRHLAGALEPRTRQLAQLLIQAREQCALARRTVDVRILEQLRDVLHVGMTLYRPQEDRQFRAVAAAAPQLRIGGRGISGRTRERGA